MYQPNGKIRVCWKDEADDYCMYKLLGGKSKNEEEESL